MFKHYYFGDFGHSVFILLRAIYYELENKKFVKKLLENEKAEIDETTILTTKTCVVLP